jgi:hypothetical protein
VITDRSKIENTEAAKVNTVFRASKKSTAARHGTKTSIIIKSNSRPQQRHVEPAHRVPVYAHDDIGDFGDRRSRTFLCRPLLFHNPHAAFCAVVYARVHVRVRQRPPEALGMAAKQSPERTMHACHPIRSLCQNAQHTSQRTSGCG